LSLLGLSYGLFADIIIEIIHLPPQPQSSLLHTSLSFKWKSHPDRAVRRSLIFVLIAIYGLKWLEIILSSILLLYEINYPNTSLTAFKSSIYLNTFPLECVFALLIEKQYYYILKTILRTFPRFCSLIAQLIALICLFTGLLLVIINHNSSGANTHYDTFSDAVWTNINVMNAADWPTPFVDLYQVLNIPFTSPRLCPPSPSLPPFFPF
jgi:hypothetical protein